MNACEPTDLEDFIRKLDQGRFKTLIDICIDVLDRFTEKLMVLPIGASGTFLWGFGFILAAIGTRSMMLEPLNKTGLELKIELFFLAAIGISLISMKLIKVYMNRINLSFKTWLLDQIDGDAGLTEVYGWFEILGNHKVCLIVTVLYTLMTDGLFFVKLSLANIGYLQACLPFAMLTVVNILSAL